MLVAATKINLRPDHRAYRGCFGIGTHGSGIQEERRTPNKKIEKKKREIMAAMKRAYLVTAICDEKLRAGNQDRMCTLGEKGWDRAHMRVWG